MSEPEPLPTNPTKAQLVALGVHDYDGLVRLAENQPPDLIEGILAHQDIAMLVGEPGIGKTPLVISIGLSVASGLPVFGHGVEQGPVLYWIGEGSVRQTTTLIETLSSHLGLASPPPDFHVHSPYWGRRGAMVSNISGLVERARLLKARMVVVDTLRTFDASAETGSDHTIVLCNGLRELNAEVGCSSLVVHHRRKPSFDHPISLEENPLAWFHEAAGTNALITQPDSRLGIEAPLRGGADLVLAGFVRGHGLIPVHYLVRRFGADDKPVGYELMSGLDRLNSRQRTVFEDLASEFTFTDVKKALGGSSNSSAANLLELLRTAGLVEHDKPLRTYRKKT